MPIISFSPAEKRGTPLFFCRENTTLLNSPYPPSYPSSSLSTLKQHTAYYYQIPLISCFLLGFYKQNLLHNIEKVNRVPGPRQRKLQHKGTQRLCQFGTWDALTQGMHEEQEQGTEITKF
jgi:hypothetical protein